jgi:uncharacterized peroxidase-related enzyme
MPRLQIPTRDGAPTAGKEILDQIYRELGVLPNLYRLIGSSPPILAAFATLQKELSQALDAKTRSRIGLVVAQVNGSDYCLSAHSYLATNFARLSPAEVALNRQGGSSNQKAAAAVTFAGAVARDRGNVSDEAVIAVRQAGYTDPEIVEIVALVALSSFTNFLNGVAQTEVDFPLVRADAA